MCYLNRKNRKKVSHHQISKIAGFKPLKNSPPICLQLAVILISLLVLSSYSLADTFVSGNITSDTTWTVDGSPYIVTSDVTVYHTSRTSGDYVRRLTIEPGVEIRFNPGTGLYIGKDYSGSYGYYGALSAQGTEAAPIIFTSNSTSALPGDWKGIYFRNPSKDSEDLLGHCVVEFAGHTHGASIFLTSASPTIKNCIFRYSGSHGIYIDNGSSPLIQDSMFTGNADSPMSIHPNQVHKLSGITGAENGKNAIEVRGGDITANVTWVKQSFPYAIIGDVTVYHTSRTHGDYVRRLTIEPGIEIRFNPGTGLYIGKDYSGSYGYYGALSAQGTEIEPIVFTSNASVPSFGDWKGIYFSDPTKDDLTVLDNCIIEYGGSTDTNKSNLHVSGSNPTIKNSTIRYSSGSGLFLMSAAPVIEKNLINENSGDGISADSNSSALIKENTLNNNGGAAIIVSANSASRVNGNFGSGNGQDRIMIRGGNITASGIWTLQAFPFVVIGDITVYHTSRSHGEYVKTLTLKPGVEVRFNPGTGLYIGKDYSDSYGYYGALDAQGTAANPIVFTSNSDTISPGDWKGIHFRDTTKDNITVLDNCVIEYGGSTMEKKRNIYCGSAHPTIRNSAVRFSSGVGIYLESSSPLVEGSTISKNEGDAVFADGSSNPRVKDNTIDQNKGAAIRIRAASVYRVTGSMGGNNIENHIAVIGGNITSSGTWTKQAFPYIVTGDIAVYHTSRSHGEHVQTLTIEPGVEIRFNSGTGLYVGKEYSGSYGYYGALDAKGMPETPIIFTSNSTSAVPGDWKGIWFRNTTKDDRTILENCVIEYGGSTADNSRNIYCDSAHPAIRNCSIRLSGGSGIYLKSSSPTVEGNFISMNDGDGIFADGGSNPLLNGNTVDQNGGTAIRIRATSVHRVIDNTGAGNGEDCIKVSGGNINSSVTWSKQGFPYFVTGDINVYHSSRSHGEHVQKLTLEPGVVVQFNPGTGIYIGKDYSGTYAYYGAFNAQGTAATPILLTSNSTNTLPGEWKGIYFRNPTKDTQSLIEHCIIEFAGHTNNANIYLNNAKPTLQYNTIRNSSHSGIYVNGSGSNGASINCNNLKDNHYGVYTVNDARPAITGNNFLRNLSAGVYNAGGAAVVAESNWWNDPNGADFNGDGTAGNVDSIPWLTSVSDCVNAPPTNTPPFAPKNPTPANGAVRVPAIDGIVTVSWLGGDPNPWDAVTYDLYFGTAAENLLILYTDTDATSAQLTGLLTGTTYHWQVVARDNTGAETSGPVWHFTTDGPPSDLVVASLTWTPMESLAAGQAITFTATITNSGSGPVVDAFQAEFKIDGASIGIASAGSILQVGESVQVVRSWTAKAGDHTVAVTADSGNKVTESDESNNSLSRTLPTIIDPTPPDLTGSVPADGAFAQTINQIRFTLVDQYGKVDDAAVIASVTVLSGGQSVNGAVAESNDQFTFVPETAPLPDGLYQVALTAVDVSGNSKACSFAFTVDRLPPAPPVITGGTVVTGLIQPRPFDNRSNKAVITLTGTREDDTSIWIDNIRKVDVGSGDWPVALNLPQGANALEIWVQDTAGNRSDSVWVDVLIDSVPPSITSTGPENDSFLNVSPGTVVIGYSETTTSLDLDGSIRALRDAGLNVVPGTWSVSGGSQLVFTPLAPLPESTYAVELQLEDVLGNRSGAVQYRFTVDTTAPQPPVIDPVASPTPNPSQIISGSKEEYAAILLNGQPIVDNTAGTTWQHPVTLTNGTNTFAFAAKDRAGNRSEAVNVEILFDDVAPDPVGTLTVNGEGDGRTVYLDWSGYNEAAHGDIASYRVYVGSAPFADVSGLSAHGTVAAGHFTSAVSSLEKGATYWFAVVAVDTRGNVDSAVTAIPCSPVDKLPPENVTNLLVSVSESNRLVFTWTHSADSDKDLAGYRIYFADETTPREIPAEENTFERSGLSAAAAYQLRVLAFDTDGNVSSGTVLTGYTLLPNPAGLVPKPYSGYVDLTWSAVTPAEHLKTYRVYVSQGDFAGVGGMTPAVTTTAATAKVAGLANDELYFFAVTAVNKSDGEQKTVATVSATPTADTEGPELSTLMVDGSPLISGHTLTRPATISVEAADPAGVSRVEFLLDGVPVRTDYSAPYTCYLNIVTLADGAHSLTITAYDTLNNATTIDHTINVALAAPLAPMITQPGNGVVINTPTLTVSGHAEKYTEVLLYNNGSETGQVVAVDALGNFGFTLTLVEGENRIQAAARYPNRTELGPLSTAVLVTLDTTLPEAPAALTALAKESGVVRLSWQPSTATVAAGTNLYRARRSFGDIGEAVRINAHLVTAAAFNDLPPEDGAWFYRATTVDAAGNESEPSVEATAVSDATPPRAVAVAYSPQGRLDPETGAMAPGTVDVVLTVSEALQAAPYLSIAPEGGTPMTVTLTRDSDQTYTGFFVIADTTPSGTAYAIFSARDVVGNRGTEIDAGAVIGIDTAGPIVKRLAVVPENPIRNDQQSPVAVTVNLGLTEALKSGTAPQLSYLLSGAGRAAVDVDSLTEVATQAGDVQSWQAAFTLPADAGLLDAETLRFVYQGTDKMGNVGDRIAAANLFQVYQGDLPPLAPPLNFAGTALPGGRIRLTWEAVAEAIGYQLFRQATDEIELTAYRRIEGVLAYLDQPAEDGLYTYAIASIRSENGQEALSGLSDPVTVAADSVAPQVPVALTLELVANGIKCAWQPPVYTEPVTYTLYRAPVSEITSVEGLTPLAAGIDQTLVVDPHPSPTEHCYTVTAVDAAGNQSTPAVSAYLNFELLPVSGITVVQADTEAPTVTWTHPGGSIAGYDIYLGTRAGGVKLNAELMTGQAYTDLGWAGDARQYTVVAVDTNQVESLGRSIGLPLVEAHYPPETLVRRGVMNRLTYTVGNASSESVENVRLKVELAGHRHTSENFGIDGGKSIVVPVVVGGFGDLPDLAEVSTTIEIIPTTGETARIVRSSQLNVADGMLAVQIENEEFTRGAAGTVRFTVENTGAEEIEIVTAKNSGNAASDQLFFYLLDADDNVIATKAFKQAVGELLVTLSNKNTVARIPAGAIFTSAPLEIDVPANAPDDLTIKFSMASLYYHQGRASQVKMAGFSTTHPVTLVDTTYYGEIVSIAPENAPAGQDITITGRAVERATGESLDDVPLNLVITLNGFERQYAVFTGTDGSFEHIFKPLAGEAGIYKVRAVHPDLTDKPVMGQFVITRVGVTPTTINLNQPRNYPKTVGIEVTAGDGTAVSNLHLEYNAADQPAGDYHRGVHLSLGSPLAVLSSKKTVTLDFTIFADNTAAATETLKLKVVSDEGAWGTVTINARFSDAKPVLYFAPDHIETGVARENTVTESVVLENRGLAAMNDVALSLVNPDGSPAPAWVVLNSAAIPGDMPVGAEQQVTVTFSPPASVAEGVYAFKLRVTSANNPTRDINLYVSVTQSGIGGALFKVSDIYTGTPAANGKIVQGLAGARVKLQNEAVLSQEFTKTTDSLGEAFFEELPAGRYKARVTAANHQEYIGRVWIKPGVTTLEDIFLDYNLVTVEWSVTETTIQDKYDIVLTAVYETNVPAAVVAIEPTSIVLPRMRAGDVYNGEISLTNYGLIRADALTFALPGSDQNFKFEFLNGSLPETIAAKQRIVIPYRVTCLQSLDREEDGTGGGCNRYVRCMTVDYGFRCANGNWTNSSVRHCWTYSYGECAASGGITPVASGGGTWNVGTGTGGGSVSMPAPAPRSIEGVKCFPEPKRKEGFCSPCYLKGEVSNFIQNVFSSVNLLMREYFLEELDMAVKVPGGTIEAKRWYYGTKWHWEHARHNLVFKLDALGQRVATIEKGGVIYTAVGDDADVFTHEFYRIIRTATGWRWEHKNGEYKLYDEVGRQTEYGNRTGVIGTLLYEPGEGGQLIGVADRGGSQVLWFEYSGDQIAAVVDASGRRVAYGYTGGRLTEVTDVTGGITRFEYDGQGRIIKKTDPENYASTVAYDKYGHVAAVNDDAGRGYRFEYDVNEGTKETFVRITAPGGAIREIWYNRDGEPKRVDLNGRTLERIDRDGRDLIITDEKGRATRKNYDEWDNLTKVVYPDDTFVSYEYEHTYNRRIRETDENGVVTIYLYDDTGNLVEKTEAADTDDERSTVYTSDADGNLLTTLRPADADTRAAETGMAYDELGNPISMTDPEGGVTHFTDHDIMGNVLTKQDARGKIWQYEYDAAGRLKTAIDPLGRTTHIFYDKIGNKIREVDADGKQTTYTHDQRGNLVSRTDPAGATSFFEYNADGKLISQTDAEGKVVRYAYDADGRLAGTIDGNGNEIILEYDEAIGSGCSTCAGGGAKDKPARVIYPTFEKLFSYDKRGRKVIETDVAEGESLVSISGYDDAGNLIARTDKEEKTTVYAYDNLNRLKVVTDALGGETFYTYDNRDNLIILTDAKNQTTRFEYDRNNRLVREIRPEGQVTSYAYDAAGNLTQKLDAKNQKIEYEYDDAGRLAEIRHYESANQAASVKTVNFTYNRAGNLTGYDDGITSALYTYDDANRKISEMVNYGPLALTNHYTYYNNGSKESFTGPDGVTYGYTYDAANHLTGVEIPGQGTITYSSYTWNMPDEVILPGGSRRHYTYDPLMRVKSIIAKDPGQNVVMSYQYNYDKMDNITAKNTENGNYDYGYDDLYRLTQADNPEQTNETYSYDGVGNRLTSAEHVDWTYNDNNELESYDGVTFQYDANGNTIEKNDNGVITRYFYNSEDRLVKVTDGAGTVIATYAYDPFGRRLWKEVDGIRTYFVYSDEGLIGEYDSSGQQIRSYGYKPGSTWTTDPVFMKVGAQYYFYQNDHLGTPQKIIGVNGAGVWSGRYNSFGKADIETGSSITNNLRFAGQYFDVETGLNYNCLRYYSPRYGRYFVPDPIGLNGGINLSIYVHNNPVNFIDPLGLWGEDVHSGIGNKKKYGTYHWAIQAGLTKGQAYLIALADNTTDNFSSWAPVVGVPGRHFDTAHGKIDSRDLHAKFDLKRAIELYKDGNVCEAYKILGRGLHSVQDKLAHMGWVPFVPHPLWYDDASKRTNALLATEVATTKYLYQFMKGITP